MPDVINDHDHRIGLIPLVMLFVNQYEKLRKTSTVITVFNSIYLEKFGFDKLYYLSDFDWSNINVLEWNKIINSLATAVKCASTLTTVSANFLNEVINSRLGVELLFTLVRHRSKGILNGIDLAVWNTKTDKMLSTNYSTVNFEKGKQNHKLMLCSKFDLYPTKALFSFI